jgi:hypothetical protein
VYQRVQKHQVQPVVLVEQLVPVEPEEVLVAREQQELLQLYNMLEVLLVILRAEHTHQIIGISLHLEKITELEMVLTLAE